MSINHYPDELSWEEISDLAKSVGKRDPFVAAMLSAISMSRLSGHEETLMDLVSAYMMAEEQVTLEMDRIAQVLSRM